MATSDLIAQLLNSYGASGSLGLAHAIKRSAQGSQNTGVSPALARFLADAESAAKIVGANAAITTPYAHPGDDPQVRAAARGVAVGSRLGQTAVDLNAAQVAYLSRLPINPQDIAFGDAVNVLALAAGPLTAADRPLVDSIAGPIQLLHDQAAAQAQIDGTAAPIEIDASAQAALSEALQAEQPGLSPADAQARAAEVVADARQNRAALHASNLADLADVGVSSPRPPSRLPTARSGQAPTIRGGVRR